MNPIEKIAHGILERFPGAEVTVDAPSKPTGSWWLDARLGENSVDVEWRPAKGFGVSSIHLGDPPGKGFGEGPDEIYSNAADAAIRIAEVLEQGIRTQPPGETPLRKLRESCGISQVELAERMGIRQATVSKMERQADMNVSTLRRMAAALGSTLEINFRFPDRTVAIDLGQHDSVE